MDAVDEELRRERFRQSFEYGLSSVICNASGACPRRTWFVTHCWSPVSIRSSPTVGRSGLRLGLVLALRRPTLCEPAVVDAARSQRAASGVGDDRQRPGGGEVRRLLAPRRTAARSRDTRCRPCRPTVLDPRLRGDRLDHVVAVGRLQRLEELERPTRASRAADVHADGRGTERTGDQRARLRRRGIPRASSRNIDDRRVGAGRADPEASL